MCFAAGIKVWAEYQHRSSLLPVPGMHSVKSSWADGSWKRGHGRSGALGPSLVLGALKGCMQSRFKLINISTYSNLNFQIESLFLTSWDLICPSSAWHHRSSQQAVSRTVNVQGGSAQHSCGQSGGQSPRFGPIHQLVQLSITTTSLHHGFSHAQPLPGLLRRLAACLVCAQIQTLWWIHWGANPTAGRSQKHKVQGLTVKVWFICIENKEKIALVRVINNWKKLTKSCCAFSITHLFF